MTKKARRIHLPVVQADERYEANYATRKQIADESARRLAAAIEACGEGADFYGEHVVHDKLGIEPPRMICCRRDDGVWTPPAPNCEERIFAESADVVTPSGVKYTTHAVTIPEGPFAEHAVTRFIRRYEVSTVTLDDSYKPRSPEQMKAAAEARRQKAIAKQAEIDAEAEREKAERLHRQPELPL